MAALILVSLAVFFRWLFFQYLNHPKRLRPGSWKAAIAGVGGALLGYALIKSVEVFGFILWLQAPSWPHYLAFAVAGWLLSVLTIPPWLMCQQRTGPRWISADAGEDDGGPGTGAFGLEGADAPLVNAARRMIGEDGFDLWQSAGGLRSVGSLHSSGQVWNS